MRSVNDNKRTDKTQGLGKIVVKETMAPYLTTSRGHFRE